MIPFATFYTCDGKLKCQLKTCEDRGFLKKKILLGVMQPEFEENYYRTFIILKINLVLKAIQQILNSYTPGTMLDVIHRTVNKTICQKRVYSSEL